MDLSAPVHQGQASAAAVATAGMALGSASIRAGSAAARYRAGLARRQEALRRRRQRLWRRAEEARQRQRRALDRHRELELITRALLVLWLSPLNGRVCLPRHRPPRHRSLARILNPRVLS